MDEDEPRFQHGIIVLELRRVLRCQLSEGMLIAKAG
jgi:hypothetical protein